MNKSLLQITSTPGRIIHLDVAESFFHGLFYFNVTVLTFSHGSTYNHTNARFIATQILARHFCMIMRGSAISYRVIMNSLPTVCCLKTKDTVLAFVFWNDLQW